VETDFESEEIGESTDYPADSGDDRNGTTMLADIASYGGSQQLHVYDNDSTKEIKRLRTLDNAISIGGSYKRSIEVTTSGYGYADDCYIQLDFYEGTTLVVSHRIDAATGDVYNEASSSYTDTGVNITLDTQQVYEV
jgi:hypothetical protein